MLSRFAPPLDQVVSLGLSLSCIATQTQDVSNPLVVLELQAGQTENTSEGKANVSEEMSAYIGV